MTLIRLSPPEPEGELPTGRFWIIFWAGFLSGASLILGGVLLFLYGDWGAAAAAVVSAVCWLITAWTPRPKETE